MAHVGLNVLEGVSNGITPFNEASISNIGILMERQRGIPNLVTEVDSLQEDRVRFGNIQAAHYGAYITRNIYKNAGSYGAVLRGCRMYAGTDADAAVGYLAGGAEKSTLVKLNTQASTDGTPQIDKHTPTAVGIGDEVTITCNAEEITFVTSTTSVSDAINGLIAAIEAKVIAAPTGEWATKVVSFTNEGTYLETTGIDGVAVTFVDSVTPVGQSAVALTLTNFQASVPPDTQVDKHTPGNVQTGDTFRISCDGEVVSFVSTANTAANVIAGLIAAITAYRAAHSTSSWATKVDTYTDETTYLETTTVAGSSVTFLDTIVSADTVMNLYAGQEGQKDPGDWANTDGTTIGLTVKVYPKNHPNGVLNNYLLEVYYCGSLVEVFQALTWVSMIDQINLKSLYVMAVPENTTLVIIGNDLVDIQTVTFSGGTYTEYASEAARATAFAPAYTNGIGSGAALFDGADIQLLIQTEVVSESNQELSGLTLELGTYCGNRTDVQHVFSLPLNANDAMVAVFSAALQESLPSFVSGYTFWVKTSNENGLQVWVPGIGCLVGAGYVRTREMGGGHAWIPPAGTDSALKDCSDITPNPLSREKVDLYVRSRSTNVAQFQKGYGFILMSSRTYSTNPLYHSTHVRMMTNWLVKTLYANLLWSIQRPNTITLRKDIVSSIRAFFKGIYENGGLETTITFAEACNIICDKTNNPTYQDRKLLNVTIEWIPVECTEAVVIQLNRNDGMLIVKALEA